MTRTAENNVPMHFLMLMLCPLVAHLASTSFIFSDTISNVIIMFFVVFVLKMLHQYLLDPTTFSASQEMAVRGPCICRRVPGWMRKLLDFLPDHF